MSGRREHVRIGLTRAFAAIPTLTAQQWLIGRTAVRHADRTYAGNPTSGYIANVLF